MFALEIVGGGRMGEALLSGLLAAGVVAAAEVVVVEVAADRRDELAARFPGVALSAEPVEAADVVVATKPAGAADAVAAAVAAGAQRVLSIAAALLADGEGTPEELRAAVTSPNGTTEAAVRRFEELGLRDVVAQAVQAATDRSRELGA